MKPPTSAKATAGKEELGTKEEKTWCPGCPNSGILNSVKVALSELVTEGKLNIKNTALVTGIGCHGKIYDYLNLNGFNGLHGRVLPVCLGMKLGNPDLTVLGFGGDGDTFDEGVSHFVHACRYNADITMMVHTNQVFALTTGQATAVTEKGFIDGSTPLGQGEKPINSIVLALELGATFVARGYALQGPHLKTLIKKAILHKGFSFIDILQPCIVYHKHSMPYLNKNVYKIEETHDVGNLNQALEKAREWDYSYEKDTKVPIGIFYETARPTFESQWPQLRTPWHTIRRKIDWPKITREFL
ncbi:MAG: Pyruvate ferredoxin/flavodoxin oxidoreductase, beta subunit [Parcubacteria group bacterium GW2011_GWF2_43_11]|nr:MAG: Pyruvate ferredoxin/flavodoxin oxidoreductase, beta subunit [Parcubacteria group bacterium GW2011_GWF2_43_11]